jgi:nicotinamidase-related amidase
MVVDVENEFCKPGGKLYSEANGPVLARIISSIQGLAEAARNAGIPIIYIQSVRTLQEPEFTIYGHDPVLKIGTWASEIVEELRPRQGDTVVQKFCHDPFYKTDLDRVLEKMVPDPTRHYAIVTGGAINICVYHAVLGLHLRHYRTVVLVDSVFYIDEAGKQRALEQFSEPPYPNVFLSRSDLIRIGP